MSVIKDHLVYTPVYKRSPEYANHGHKADECVLMACEDENRRWWRQMMNDS